jgi:hypothetical protein
MVSLLVGKDRHLAPVTCKRDLFLDLHTVHTDVIDVNIEVLKETSYLPAERT